MNACQHCHHEPSYQHREAQQQPYRGLWQGVVARIADMSPDMPVYQRDLDKWLVELWDAQPDAVAALAVNTTRYDRPLDELAG